MQLTDLPGRLLTIPARIDGILRGIESLERLAEFDESLRVLGTFEKSLSRLADSVEALPELTRHAEALAELTKHAGALEELTTYAATLPELTRHAAALPELQPTVDELTLAAADLKNAVAPIGRIAGRLPGSRERAPQG